MRTPVASLLLVGLSAGISGCASGSSTWWERMMVKVRGKPLAEAFRDIHDPEPDLRRESIIVLGTNATTRVNPLVHEAIADKGLGVIKDGKRFEPDDDVQVRVAALMQLRRNNADLTDDQRMLLRECMVTLDEGRVGGAEFNKRNMWLRVEAAECLGVFVHDKGAETLAAALRTDPEFEVKLAAAKALGKCSPVDNAVQLKIGAALIENVTPLAVDRPAFSLKYESLLSLQELTGRGDIGFDPEAWRKHFADQAAEPFRQAGTLPVRVPVRPSTWENISSTASRLLYYVRKPARTED